MALACILRTLPQSLKSSAGRLQLYGTSRQSTQCFSQIKQNKIPLTTVQSRLYTVTKQAKKIPKEDLWVGRWLLGCAGMVFGAVSLGGLTRLTESGLSMTDWRLLGKLPPRNEAEWIREFDRYKLFPEFAMKNKDITLKEFKFIWWMEYGHRQWGRLIGAAYAIPALIFWAKGWIAPHMKKRVLIFGGLILCQGLMGWYMVKSGLEKERFQEPSDVPRVSQYRLMTHLGFAFALYTLLLWNGLSLVLPAEFPKEVSKSAMQLRRLAHVTKGWIFLTAMSGALVAGLDAGLVYNSFPKMADKWIPNEILSFSPTLRNFTENPTTVQFDHRILGTTALVLSTAVGLWARKVVLPVRARKAAAALSYMAWVQVGLGITTLLMYVPVSYAALHQSGSLITLSFAVWLTHEMKHLKRFIK